MDSSIDCYLPSYLFLVLEGTDMKKECGHVLVIGASNLDIKGHTRTYHVAKTSNPGTVKNSAGGVARNIAENLARMGKDVKLLSAVGDDNFGRQIKEITGSAGVDLSHMLISKEQNTGIFLAIMNNYGDLESAVADLDIINLLTPEYLDSCSELFENASFVVVDADIPSDTLLYCIGKCEKYNVPLCVEPISVARAKQIVPYLNKISMVTPNREEAEVLAGFPLRTADDVRNAGSYLVERGIRWAIITLGPEGVLYATKDEIEFIPSISTVVTDTVGAGDALTSGTVCGLIDGLSIRDSVKRGIACATLTLKTDLAVHPELSLEKIF